MNKARRRPRSRWWSVRSRARPSRLRRSSPGRRRCRRLTRHGPSVPRAARAGPPAAAGPGQSGLPRRAACTRCGPALGYGKAARRSLEAALDPGSAPRSSPAAASRRSPGRDRQDEDDFRSLADLRPMPWRPPRRKRSEEDRAEETEAAVPAAPAPSSRARPPERRLRRPYPLPFRRRPRKRQPLSRSRPIRSPSRRSRPSSPACSVVRSIRARRADETLALSDPETQTKKGLRKRSPFDCLGKSISRPGRPARCRSWRSCASSDSVAMGRASRRLREIGSPVSSQ